MNKKLQTFRYDGQTLKVRFVESYKVIEGVHCDVYAFENDETKDLAIIMVEKGRHSPRQKVLKGDVTVQGFLRGKGRLVVAGSRKKEYHYPGNADSAVAVKVGEIMQWFAEEDLVYFELCTPPYVEGRYEDLSDE